MRRRAVLERVEQEAEAVVGFLVGQADHLEHLGLQVGAVDADGAGGQLDAVHHQVVGAGADLLLVAVHVAVVLLVPAGEGMVGGHIALLLLAVLEQRELGDPEQVVLALVDQALALGDLAAQRAQALPDDGLLVRAEEHDVAGLGVHLGAHNFDHLGGHELVEGGLHVAVGGEGHVGQALGAVGLDELGQRIDLLAGHGRQTLGVDGLHAAALCDGVVEDHEAAVCQLVRQVLQAHLKAGVGLVGAVVLHGVVPGHAGQGKLKLHALDLPEDAGEHALDHGVDVLLVDEGHFDVALGELRLTVGAVVLVAEAAGDLVVLVKAGEHQQLLVDLGTLGQGVEGAGMQAAGHQEVARALGRGLGQDGGLHLSEALLVQRAADAGDHLGAHAQLLLHGGAAQIQIAVLQAHQLVFVGLVVDVDRRGLALVQQHRVAHHDLDLAGLELAVDGALVAQAHLALHGQHVLAAQALGQSKQLGGAVVSVKHQLHKTLAVAQPDEHQAAQVAGALHPAGEMHGLTGHFAGQQAAVMIALVGKHSQFLLYVK